MELSESEIKRDKMTFGSFTNLNNISNTSNNNGQTNIINSLNSNSLGTLGIIRSEELSKMFPTPPSIEQHNINLSPGNICGNITDNLIENIDNVVSHKMEPYPNFGSPVEEPIEASTIIIFTCFVHGFEFTRENVLLYIIFIFFNFIFRTGRMCLFPRKHQIL